MAAGNDGASAESGRLSIWGLPFMLAFAGGFAFIFAGTVLTLAIGAHRKKRRRQYECLPYNNQVTINQG